MFPFNHPLKSFTGLMDVIRRVCSTRQVVFKCFKTGSRWWNRGKRKDLRGIGDANGNSHASTTMT